MDGREALERRANRGVPRGADQVLQDAVDAKWVPATTYTDLAEHARPGRDPRHRRVAAVAAVMLAAASVLALRSARATGPVDSAAAPVTAPPHVTLTPEQEAAAQKQLKDNIAKGWMLWAIAPAVPVSEPLPRTGWIRVGPGIGQLPFPVPVKGPDGQDRTIIYDQPDGKPLGYVYMDFGFVPFDVGDDPGFQAAAIRRRLGLCQPDDQKCVHADVQQHLDDYNKAHRTETGNGSTASTTGSTVG